LQVEISEVFDKLHVSETDSAIEVTSSSSCNSNSGHESPQQPLPTPSPPQPPVVFKKPERPSPHDIDEWNSLAQFENFIKLEMENLETAAKNSDNRPRVTAATATTVSTTAVKSNILKPEKHVSDNAWLIIPYFTYLLFN
jgi:hypothetical protein